MDGERAAALHAALGSEVRLHMLELIAAHKEMCACELVDQLGLSQATISRHVAVLRRAGIVRSRRVGGLALLRVDESTLAESFGSLLDRVRELHALSAELDVETRLLDRCAVQASV